jgi:hypothetical protein
MGRSVHAHVFWRPSHEDIYHLWKGMTNIRHKIYSRFHAIKYIQRHEFHWESGWNIPSIVIQQMRNSVRTVLIMNSWLCSSGIFCALWMFQTKALRRTTEPVNEKVTNIRRVLYYKDIHSSYRNMTWWSNQRRWETVAKFINKGIWLSFGMLHRVVW